MKARNLEYGARGIIREEAVVREDDAQFHGVHEVQGRFGTRYHGEEIMTHEVGNRVDEVIVAEGFADTITVKGAGAGVGVGVAEGITYGARGAGVGVGVAEGITYGGRVTETISGGGVTESISVGRGGRVTETIRSGG